MESAADVRDRAIVETFEAIRNNDSCPICGGCREDGHAHDCALATAYSLIKNPPPPAPVDPFDGRGVWTGTHYEWVDGISDADYGPG